MGRMGRARVGKSRRAEEPKRSASPEEAVTWYYQPHQDRFQEAADKWPTLPNYLSYMRNETARLNPENLREVIITDTPCLTLSLTPHWLLWACDEA